MILWKSAQAALVVVAALVLGSAGCDAQTRPALDDAFDAKVHAYLLAHPEVIEEAMEKLQADQDAQKAVAAQASIAAHRQALEHDARDGVAGNPNGPITVVEFYDYRCPYCKAAEPELERLLVRHPDVRLVLKEFPILDVEDQSHISEDASRAALAALSQGRYLKVHDDLLAQTKLDEDAIARVLAADGVDLPRDRVEAKSQAVSTQLAQTHQLARDLGVDGTPAFVIDGKMIAGAQLDDLEAAISAHKPASTAR